MRALRFCSTAVLGSKQCDRRRARRRLLRSHAHLSVPCCVCALTEAQPITGAAAHEA